MRKPVALRERHGSSRLARRLRHPVVRWGFTGLTAALWLVFLLPQQLGGSAAYVVVAGQSMEPTLWDGDLVVTRSAEAYAVGDVVAFRAPEGMVIHRIVGGSAETGFVTQGDNRSSVDLWRSTPEEIVGRSWLRIPAGGRVFTAVRSPLMLATVAAVFTFLATSAGRRRTPEPDGDDSE